MVKCGSHREKNNAPINVSKDTAELFLLYRNCSPFSFPVFLPAVALKEHLKPVYITLTTEEFVWLSSAEDGHTMTYCNAMERLLALYVLSTTATFTAHFLSNAHLLDTVNLKSNF